MPEIIELVFAVLHLIAALSALGALYLAFKLFRETDKGWYWLSLLLSAFFFALAQWIFVLFPLIPFPPLLGTLRDISELAAILLFAISCYGIYKGMMEIRKMVG